MSVDHRPHLLPTDLRTPEDVLAWLRLVAPLYLDLSYHLARRLDRERRQACRRGALARFKMFAWYGRQVRSGGCDFDDEDFASEMAWDDAADCLAFRAAARSK